MGMWAVWDAAAVLRHGSVMVTRSRGLVLHNPTILNEGLGEILLR